MTALIAQVETQQTLPSMAVSIVADTSGYRCTMTCCSGMWNGYDLTHQIQVDRSTAVQGPSTPMSYPSSPVFQPLSWYCKWLFSDLLWSSLAPVKHQALWCSQFILSHLPTCPAEHMDEVLEMYAPSPVSLPAGTAPTSSAVTASTSKKSARRPAYYPPSENISGSLTTRNANRLWEVAPDLVEQQHCDRDSVFQHLSWIRRSCEICPSSLMFHAYESI